MATYMICDQDGYEITDGLQEQEAAQVAQCIADEQGESVWLSESGSKGMGERFRPRRHPIEYAPEN